MYAAPMPVHSARTARGTAAGYKVPPSMSGVRCSGCSLRRDPFEIPVKSPRDWSRDNFRKFIGMRVPNGALQRRIACSRGFHEQQMLGIDTRLALPLVD